MFKYFCNMLLNSSLQLVETFVNLNDITVYSQRSYRVRKAIFHSFSVCIRMRLYVSRKFNLINH